MADANREKWFDADRLAVAIQLARNNRLVRVDRVPKGAIIAPCVMVRKVRTHADTGELKAVRPFYSRMAIDGLYQAKVMAKRGEQHYRPRHATAVSPLAVKLNLGDAAIEDYDITAVDVPHAYGQGERQRPPGYVRLPRTVEWQDEDGVELVIELNDPGEGEGPSGDEWEVTAETAIAAMGWSKAECVPNAFHFNTGNGVARLLRNVDEFLLFTPTTAEGKATKEATIAAMRAKWGQNDVLGDVRVEVEPSEWVGLTWFRDRARRALTVYMNKYVEEAVAQHAPEIAREKNAITTRLKSGEARDMFDKLALAPKDKRPEVLSKAAKQVQSIVGALKYPEPVLPRISLGLHKLSCVVSCPADPDLALTCCKVLLEHAWNDRFKGVTYGGLNIKSNERSNANFHGPRKPRLRQAAAGGARGDGRRDVVVGERPLRRDGHQRRRPSRPQGQDGARGDGVEHRGRGLRIDQGRRHCRGGGRDQARHGSAAQGPRHRRHRLRDQRLRGQPSGRRRQPQARAPPLGAADGAHRLGLAQARPHPRPRDAGRFPHQVGHGQEDPEVA